MSSRRFTKAVAPVIDLDFDMRLGPHTPAILARKVEMLAALGFRRLYFIVPPPSYPMCRFPPADLCPQDHPDGHWGLQSILDLGDAAFATTFEAHKRGLEAFAVVKPYEGGGLYSLPHGARPTTPRHCLTDIGGEWEGFDSFIAAHPDLRIQRRPIKDYPRLVGQPIERIELAFCLDEVKDRAAPDEFITYGAQVDSVIASRPIAGLRLWFSYDNGIYEPYTGDLTIKESLQQRTILDANGRPCEPGPRRCRVVNISGLQLPAEVSYLGIEFDPAGGGWPTIPFSMIRLFGAAGEIPATCTEAVRQPPMTVGAAAKPDFRQVGFEFEKIDAIFWGNGWRTGGCYGLARGKMKYMKGTLCEAFPEVRRYWLDQVEKLVAMGVDGVDVRLQAHSSGVTDYMSYGYNAPLAAEYQRRHGVDILAAAADPLELMRIRGDYFGEFLTEAATTLHAAGRTLQVHLHDCDENPVLGHGLGELGFFAMPKVLLDWEKVVRLADEITVKDYNWGSYAPQPCAGIKTLAAKLGKPVWVHCYLQQGWDLNEEFCAAVEGDKRITGLLLYEVAHSRYGYGGTSAGMIGVTPEASVYYNQPTIDAIRRLLLRGD